MSPVEEGSSYALGTVPDHPVLDSLGRVELVTSRSAEVSPASLSPIIPESRVPSGPLTLTPNACRCLPFCILPCHTLLLLVINK